MCRTEVERNVRELLEVICLYDFEKGLSALGGQHTSIPAAVLACLR